MELRRDALQKRAASLGRLLYLGNWRFGHILPFAWVRANDRSYQTKQTSPQSNGRPAFNTERTAAQSKGQCLAPKYIGPAKQRLTDWSSAEAAVRPPSRL